MTHTRRLPVSARHAFALAFDLAVRRDWLHSLLVPLLLRLPWIVIPAAVPFLVRGIAQSQLVLVQATGALLDFLAMVVVTSMLRFRARSVFHTAPGDPVGPVGPCYRLGLARTPALYVTEFARNLVFSLSFSMLVVPLLYLGFKLSMATEAVVLRDVGPFTSFSRSYRLTEGRFERWLEMIAMSVFLIVPLWFLMALGFLVVPSSSWSTWVAVGFLLSAAIQPVVQYAWTFFYLRLEDSVAVQDGGSADEWSVTATPAPPATWAGRVAPQLRLVELDRDDPDEGPPEP
jgi:hypothetical protein